MVNPFRNEDDELLHITSGAVATKELQEDLQSGNDRGEVAFITLCKDRVQTHKVHLFATNKETKVEDFCLHVQNYKE